MRMTAEEFFWFCQANDVWQIEREPDGEIVMMPPGSLEWGGWAADVGTQLRTWAKKDGRGKTFSSRAGFTLPNGAVRAADASWLSLPRYSRLTREELDRFAPVCPEFVVEIKPRYESVPRLKRKMQEYVENGAELGWLIVPDSRTVFVYRPGAPEQTFVGIKKLAGEGPVEGFELDLAEIWSGL